MFAYKRLAQGLGEVGCAGQVSEPVKVSAPYEPFGMLYLAPALGVLVARLLGLGFYGMLLAGRLANLALYIGLAGVAVRRMPFAGNMLFCVGLLPMCLQLAASFSPDALVLGLSFALFALALECADQNCPVSGRQAAGLVILSALLAPCKAIYLGLAALCFAIPAERFARPGARLSGVRRARRRPGWARRWQAGARCIWSIWAIPSGILTSGCCPRWRWPRWPRRGSGTRCAGRRAAPPPRRKSCCWPFAARRRWGARRLCCCFPTWVGSSPPRSWPPPCSPTATRPTPGRWAICCGICPARPSC